mmetsp:Transcript_2028/g.7657  ORF Transcript_2028/g.7657 Transcript_2028/m.7657 type:complete len:227 (-) Transcript_2028:651-1331(-)
MGRRRTIPRFAPIPGRPALVDRERHRRRVPRPRDVVNHRVPRSVRSEIAPTADPMRASPVNPRDGIASVHHPSRRAILGLDAQLAASAVVPQRDRVLMALILPVHVRRPDEVSGDGEVVVPESGIRPAQHGARGVLELGVGIHHVAARIVRAEDLASEHQVPLRVHLGAVTHRRPTNGVQSAPEVCQKRTRNTRASHEPHGSRGELGAPRVVRPVGDGAEVRVDGV